MCIEDYRIARLTQAVTTFIKPGNGWAKIASRSAVRTAIRITPIDVVNGVFVFQDLAPTYVPASFTTQLTPQTFDLLHHGDIARSPVWIYVDDAGRQVAVTETFLTEV